MGGSAVPVRCSKDGGSERQEGVYNTFALSTLLLLLFFRLILSPSTLYRLLSGVVASSFLSTFPLISVTLHLRFSLQRPADWLVWEYTGTLSAFY